MSDHYDVIVIGSGAGGGTLVAPAWRRRASGSCCSSAATGCTREPQNWLAQDVFVDGRYVSPDTWYYADGEPFQPQVHYFVGGATKLYGAALYRLRQEDFGELQHHDGISPAWPISYEEMEPYYTRAEQLYQVHGARGEDPDRAARQRAVSLPGGLARAAHPAALRRPRGGGPAPVPRAVRDPARRGQHAVQQVRAVPELRRLPLPGARQVRRRGDRGPPGARAPERHAADRRRGGAARDQRRRHRRHGVVVKRDGRDRDVPGRHRRRLLRRGQQRQAAARLASDKHPRGLANGSDQVGRNYMFHNSQAVLALSKEENPTVFQKTLGGQRLLLLGR